MIENTNARDGAGDAGRERPSRAPEFAQPLSDREVPLVNTATGDIINRWLDGELPEPTTLRGDAARHVEFWRRIGEETDRRRHMVTPAHVQERIMEALPSIQTQTATPWFKRTVQISPAAALAAAAGLLALGAALTAALRLR
jgi:hypothetical protein